MADREIEIGAFEAKTRLAELLRENERGRSFIISRRGRPVARLVPFEGERRGQDLEALLSAFHEIRKRVKGKVAVRELLEQGRRY